MNPIREKLVLHFLPCGIDRSVTQKRLTSARAIPQKSDSEKGVVGESDPRKIGFHFLPCGIAVDVTQKIDPAP